MSVVYITDHSEKIYHISCSPDDLLDEQTDEAGIGDEAVPTSKDQRVPKPRKMHTSADKRVSHTHAYFGIPNDLKPDPQNFLKKKANHVLQAHFIPKCSKKRKILTIPPVPDTKETVKEQMKKLMHPPQNIIKRNIDKVVNAKAKPPNRVVVVDHHGTKRKLCYEGEVKYITSKGFAKLPKYIDTYKMMKENEFLEEVQRKAKAEQPLCTYIVRDHRSKLLEGLKSNWEELQSQYQTLPILTDTIPKKNRKSKIEKELRQLEKDIVALERHPYIYVYKDDIQKEMK